MNDIDLIPVSKDGEYAEVHPTALQNYRELGWLECGRAQTTTIGHLQVDVSAELRDQLEAEAGRIRDELAVDRDHLRVQNDNLVAKAAELEAEAARLTELSASLDARAKALESQEDAAQKNLTAAQLREQLTAKGISFKSGDSKAELQAALDASV